MEFSLSEPRTIFVTGATGFIGTYVTQKLLDRGHHVVGMCRSAEPKLPPGYPREYGELWGHPRFRLVRGDILSLDALRDGMAGCDAVIHMAAYAKNYSRTPETFEQINICGMRNVFTVARDLGVRKVVWTSTIVTFGPTARGVVGDESMPRITDRCLTEYEETKTVAEREALQWAADGLPLTIVNPARVYGPGQLSEGNAMAGLIDDFDSGRMPILLNRGVNVGNYGYVEDVAEGHILALERGRVGERYILGGENATLGQLFALIEKVTGRRHFKVPIWKFWPMVLAYTLLGGAKVFGFYPRITPGWMRTFMVDWAYSVEKARNELGYAPIPLEDGLRRTCQWLHDVNAGKRRRGR